MKKPSTRKNVQLPLETERTSPRHSRPLPRMRRRARREGDGGMRRRLFTLAAGLSAVLCAATLLLWLRSYWVGDALSINLPQFGRPLADETLNVVSGRGG